MNRLSCDDVDGGGSAEPRTADRDAEASLSTPEPLRLPESQSGVWVDGLT